jgi:hypothetical protein
MLFQKRGKSQSKLSSNLRLRTMTLNKCPWTFNTDTRADAFQCCTWLRVGCHPSPGGWSRVWTGPSETTNGRSVLIRGSLEGKASWGWKLGPGMPLTVQTRQGGTIGLVQAWGLYSPTFKNSLLVICVGQVWRSGHNPWFSLRSLHGTLWCWS